MPFRTILLSGWFTIPCSALTWPFQSEDTVERARNAQVELLSSDLELVQQCSAILSVVPPRDAEATAQRIIDALSGQSRQDHLFFADLNAVSPKTSRETAAMFEKARVPVRFVDGCIIGGPPRAKFTPDSGTNVTQDISSDDFDWIRPSIPVSGPHSLSSLPSGDRLVSVLNMRSISREVGAASGLKMCFAAISKGFTALATQSFSTAHRLGVAGELRSEMASLFPAHMANIEKNMPAMVPKAYRWVREMKEIAATMKEDGGWDSEIFDGVAQVYRSVADDPVLGKEKTGKRKHGTSVEDVAESLADGLEKKRKKME